MNVNWPIYNQNNIRDKLTNGNYNHPYNEGNNLIIIIICIQFQNKIITIPKANT